jgi:hypothetical protein
MEPIDAFLQIQAELYSSLEISMTGDDIHYLSNSSHLSSVSGTDARPAFGLFAAFSIPQHYGRVHQSSGYIEPQVDDQAEVPLDAFG